MGKVIAVIDKPKNCQDCVFGICKYSLPLSMNRKGYYCQLLPPKQRKTQDFDYDAEVHLDNCPLVPLPEKIQEPIDADDVGEEYSNGTMDGWNNCIDTITGEREKRWMERLYRCHNRRKRGNMTIVIVFKNGYELKMRCKEFSMKRNELTGRATSIEYFGVTENKIIDIDFSEVLCMYRVLSDEQEEKEHEH